MAFVIGAIQSVKRKVKFDLPTDDGRPAAKADFIVELKVHDQDKAKERQQAVQDYMAIVRRETAKVTKDPDYEPEIPAVSFDDAYLREDVLNLEGILAADKSEIPFSDDLLDSVLRDRAARAGLITVWAELNTGNGVKRKN